MTCFVSSTVVLAQIVCLTHALSHRNLRKHLFASGIETNGVLEYFDYAAMLDTAIVCKSTLRHVSIASGIPYHPNLQGPY